MCEDVSRRPSAEDVRSIGPRKHRSAAIARTVGPVICQVMDIGRVVEWRGRVRGRRRGRRSGGAMSPHVSDRARTYCVSGPRSSERPAATGSTTSVATPRSPPPPRLLVLTPAEHQHYDTPAHSPVRSVTTRRLEFAHLYRFTSHAISNTICNELSSFNSLYQYCLNEE